MECLSDLGYATDSVSSKYTLSTPKQYKPVMFKKTTEDLHMFNCAGIVKAYFKTVISKFLHH